MADHLSQGMDLPQRESLYSKLSEASSSLQKQTSNGQLVAKRRLADASENIEDSEQLDISPVRPSSTRTTLNRDFQKLGFFRRLYFYFLSIFSHKPAEHLFRETQLNEVRQEIHKLNNDLIVFDWDNKHLVGPYLAERFNGVFRLTLEVLPIVNQIDRNPKFMEDIVLKLIFGGYNAQAEKPIQINTSSFTTEDEMRKHVFMGDKATKAKISELMEEVGREGKNLPLSMYKYGAKTLLPLYQFQKICYFPFSSFFHTFRTANMDQESIYSAILPQSAYDSVSMLYQLINEIGLIDLDKNHFQEILNSYVLTIGSKDNSNKTSLDYMESFVRLASMWNSFVKQIPIQQLLLFASEDPYLDPPLTPEIENEVLEHLPSHVEKVYQSMMLESIVNMVRSLRKTRNEFFFKKYFSDITFEYSKYYSNERTDLKPQTNMTDSELGILFAHCESFAYARNFLRTFCNENFVRPLNILCKGVFRSDNYTYNRVIDFLNGLEAHKNRLGVLEHNLEPDHRIDIEIKAILQHIEQRTEGAKEEYANMLLNLDREIRSLIEGLIKDMQDFAVHTIPIIESLIQQEETYYIRFTSFVARFQFMHDFNNPALSPFTPEKILGLWKQYTADITLLLHDQLEEERQSILGKISRIARRRPKK